jgi:hypothetical protein
MIQGTFPSTLRELAHQAHRTADGCGCTPHGAHHIIVSVCGYAACGIRMRVFCSIATEVFGYVAIWLWAALETHNIQTRTCAHFDA